MKLNDKNGTAFAGLFPAALTDGNRMIPSALCTPSVVTVILVEADAEIL
jgi:hypothetical protein